MNRLEARVRCIVRRERGRELDMQSLLLYMFLHARSNSVAADIVRAAEHRTRTDALGQTMEQRA